MTWCTHCDAQIWWEEALGWGAADGWECAFGLEHAPYIPLRAFVLAQLVGVYHELRS